MKPTTILYRLAMCILATIAIAYVVSNNKLKQQNQELLDNPSLVAHARQELIAYITTKSEQCKTDLTTATERLEVVRQHGSTIEYNLTNPLKGLD